MTEKFLLLGSDEVEAVMSNRIHNLPGTAYKLATGGQYGMDVSVADMDIDEKSMSVMIPFADGNRRDGVGDLLDVEGIRTERHRRNPIVLFDHGKHVQMPVGMAEDPNTGNYTVQIDPISKTARGRCFFYQAKMITPEMGIVESPYDHALFCEQLFDLIAKKFIRAGSIGYQVIKSLPLDPDYGRGTPKGLHLLEVLMLEMSAVVLPANGDTVRKALALPSVCGKPMSPYLIKSLEPYAPEKVVQMGYEGKSYFDQCPRDETGHCLKRGAEDQSSSDHKPKKHPKPKTNDDDSKKRKETTSYEKSRSEKWQVSLTDGTNLKFNATDEKDAVEQANSTIKKYGWKTKVKAASKVKGKKKKKTKSLGEIRQRYRSSAKSFRRRLKKSSPGASMIYMRGKDLSRAEAAAKAKGVRLQRMGPHKNFEKVKLLGDDEAIDSLAKEFGAAILGRKSIDGGNHMAAVLQKKTKAMDEEGMVPGDQPPPPEDDVVEEDEVLEPLGAQVLRRLYEHQNILMEEYDQFMQILEQENVKGHLQKILEQIEENMTLSEELFSEAYPELKLILEEAEEMEDGAENGEEVDAEVEDGVGDKSVPPDEDPMDDNPAEPTPSEPPEDLPPPDEVVEGMDTSRRKKSLTAKVKQIRAKVKSCKCCGGKDAPLEKTEDAKPKAGLAETPSPNPSDHKPAEHHMPTLRASTDFLGNVAQAQELSDELRFDSYHYSKTLGGMIEVEDMASDDKNLDAGNQSMEGGDTASPMPSEEKGWHKAVKETSTFLGELATSSDFGDNHRERAKNCQGMMSKVLEEFDSKPEDPGDQHAEDEELLPEPGEMDTKMMLKDLSKQNQEMHQEMEELSKKLAALAI